MLALLQAGIVRYAREYAAGCRVAGIAADESVGYARTCADRLMRYPTAREARLLFSFASVCDLGLDVVRVVGRDELAASRNGVWRRLPALVRTSLWPAGALALRLGRVARHPFLVWHAVRSAARRGAWPDRGIPRPLRSGLPTCEVSGAGGEEAVERAVSAAAERVLEAARNSGPAAVRPLQDPLDFEYVLASALSRRWTNALCAVAGKQPYVADGLSHRRLLRRLLLGGRRRPPTA